MMDGGRGQVNIALGVLEQMGLSIPVCGMVKDDFHRTRGLYFNNKEVPIDRHSEASGLLRGFRMKPTGLPLNITEASGKRQVRSVLDEIPGIGPARRKALMRQFKDIEAIRNADIQELAQTPQMNQKAAEAVYHFFRKTGGHSFCGGMCADVKTHDNQ